jgi:hypothetical protein
MARPPRWQCDVQIRTLHLVLPPGMLYADAKVGHERRGCSSPLKPPSSCRAEPFSRRTRRVRVRRCMIADRQMPATSPHIVNMLFSLITSPSLEHDHALPLSRDNFHVRVRKAAKHALIRTCAFIGLWYNIAESRPGFLCMSVWNSYRRAMLAA